VPTADTIEFRVEDYRAAHENQLFSSRAAARAELPGHPDLTPPTGPELEPAQRGVFIVGYINGQPAASGGYREFTEDTSGETVEFVRMYVRADSRRSGVGRALLIELEERAIDDDYRRAIMWVGLDQPAAQGMFELLGYRRVPGEPDSLGRVRVGKKLDD
jgi:GNAT superfamily N-acetyltransferase